MKNFKKRTRTAKRPPRRLKRGDDITYRDGVIRILQPNRIIHGIHLALSEEKQFLKLASLLAKTHGFGLKKIENPQYPWAFKFVRPKSRVIEKIRGRNITCMI